MEAHLSDALTEMCRGLDQLADIGEPQAAFGLLRECVVGRPHYLSRLLCPSDRWWSTLEDFDAAVWATLRSLLRDTEGTGALEEDAVAFAKAQTSLPVRFGGMGLRSARQIAPLSYLCSWAQTLPALLHHFPSLFQRPSAGSAPLCPGHAAAVADLPDQVQQRMLPEVDLATHYPHRYFQERSAILHTSTLEALRNHPRVRSHPQQTQRLTSLQGPHAGAWVVTRPRSRGDHLYLSGSDWRICTRVRLGLPLPELRRLGTWPCGIHVVPTEPRHVFRCNRARGGAIHSVHAALRRVVASVVVDSGLGTHVRP